MEDCEEKHENLQAELTFKRQIIKPPNSPVYISPYTN
jgi:hypothetical protein